MVVSATGTFLNSTNIVVSAGTLTLQNSGALSDDATVRIANGGAAKVSLASGVNETVRYLVFGDKEQRSGTYGSTSSTADYTSNEHFAGEGVLTVLRGNSGTLISVR